MADIVTSDMRSRMMSRIRGKDTGPERVVRSLLHKSGFRFRLHRRDLPGRPDLVLPKYRAAIFVHGCFWHAHDGCRYFREPKTNPAFWKEKLSANIARDSKNMKSLAEMGWRVLVVWECAIRDKDDLTSLRAAMIRWLRSRKPFGQIP